jgi:hypothetical protein
MQQPNLHPAYEIAQLRRHPTRRRQGKVITWVPDVPGAEPGAPWWTEPLLYLRSHLPGAAPGPGFRHPRI